MIDMFWVAMACHARRKTARKPPSVMSLGLAAVPPVFRSVILACSAFRSPRDPALVRHVARVLWRRARLTAAAKPPELELSGVGRFEQFRKRLRLNVSNGAQAALPRCSIGVARQLAIEHPHHGFEEQVIALRSWMTVVLIWRLHPRDDLVGEYFERSSCAHRQYLRAAHALELVESPIGLCNRVSRNEHAMAFHEQNGLVTDYASQAFALVECICGSRIGVVIGNVAVEKSCGLVGRHQTIILEHVQRQCPRLVRVQHHPCAADSMDRCMYALRRQLDNTLALERLPCLIEYDHVARPRLRPVQAEGQDQISIVAAGYGDREMVVDPFLQLVQDGQAVGGGELNLRLQNGIDRSGRSQRMNGHGESPQDDRSMSIANIATNTGRQRTIGAQATVEVRPGFLRESDSAKVTPTAEGPGAGSSRRLELFADPRFSRTRILLTFAR